MRRKKEEERAKKASDKALAASVTKEMVQPRRSMSARIAELNLDTTTPHGARLPHKAKTTR